MTAQRDEPLGLSPVPAFQHSDDSGSEVVVTYPGQDAAEVLERQHMALEERLLGLGAERDMERPPRMGRPRGSARTARQISHRRLPATS